MNTGITSFNADAVQSFIRFAQHPFKFSAFLFWKLPSAWLCGVRAKSLTPDVCVTSVPYRWISQNPFQSTYFACLAMAAELSTGLPAMMYVRSAPKRVSMLVTNIQATFVKKATGLTFFTCTEVPVLRDAMAQAIRSGEPVTVTIHTEGKDKDGTLIATFAVTWSFKSKS
ncbi:DUF4442 domain-containing protein [Chitinophaga nivalis]|uniref:DUF4442 domain-containing protein n=1 Tax=Chitinophaga nivalis TaxID=2991709 RepID=A0ABT3IWX4_9BACT|nr:DUF4442 domain-containing protein [Chitinophaga nivalis]MCW3461829.1 DUF4442 domain-containing protein [Chitinophaga nivalis]MCW3488477.1 DUF4442 domain-containing protein [Chitinophaga nivalis]